MKQVWRQPSAVSNSDSCAPGWGRSRRQISNLQRDWDDARRYGFVSAGGGNWYSKALHRLSPGDRLLVYLPGRGYAGIATAPRRAAPIKDAVVDIDGHPTRLSGPELHAEYTYADDSGVGLEWVVSRSTGR